MSDGMRDVTTLVDCANCGECHWDENQCDPLKVIAVLRTALADARRENDAMAAVVEAAERYVDATKQGSFALTDSFRALQSVHDTVRAHRARAKEGKADA